LQGKLKTGKDVANLAAAEWSEKVKTAIGLDDVEMKSLFDELLIIRRQIRNYMAHGALGKQGEAFEFHSSAGAVPVILNRCKSALIVNRNGPCDLLFSATVPEL
jgi:hypothetical protein